jgi:hypothetical protein
MMRAAEVRVAQSLAAVVLATAGAAHAEPFDFSTGNTDGKLAAASRPASGGPVAVETADDFPLISQTTITTAVVEGLIPSSESASDVTSVTIEVYRIFPLDSTNPPSGQVPTRVNSPSDVAFDSRDSIAHSLNFTVTLFGGFSAVNSVVNGIHPVPTQTTGGEGAVFGNEVVITATLNPPIVLPAGHYFFVPQVALTSGTFLWLSAPKPITSPGTPFVGDLQSWIRNADLDPDWLRIGTDIVGSGSFNQAFSLSGTNDIIFRDGFD